MGRSFSHITMVGGFGQSASNAYGYVLRQPSWVLRIALTLAAFVLIAILLVLIVPVVLIGAAAFIALAGVAKVRSWLGGTTTRRINDGRENVRVIVRDGPG